jgi:type VI secretion system protein ImpH
MSKPTDSAPGADPAPTEPADEAASRPAGAGAAGVVHAPWLEALRRAPWRFGFLQTLRRLDCAQPGRPRIGGSPRAADDPVRLGQRPSMRFPPAELAGLDRTAAGRPDRLSVYFFGLLGPHGPMPLHLTDYARRRIREHNDPTFARFLDVFNHRMLALYFRGWAQAQPAVSFDRPDEDRFGDYLSSLGGTGMPSLQRRDAMPDLAKRRFAAHLGCQARHPDGLRSMLSVLLGVPVRIEELIGHWLTLPDDCRWRLGADRANGALGQTTTVGARVWDHQSKFRVRVGPVPLGTYEALLPGGALLPQVKAVVRNYVGDQLDWDLRPVLAEAEVPRLRLGVAGRLGWTTWLASGALGRDGDDLELDPETASSTQGNGRPT